MAGENNGADSNSEGGDDVKASKSRGRWADVTSEDEDEDESLPEGLRKGEGVEGWAVAGKKAKRPAGGSG
eukprot:CAMPEP_0204019088 /NCGR_PEP_ID=MMETSP0360-20130528/28513_1 /ASSEMBLY_ACC=CAM_ASM_000342 /TAXON_ID=268821 /ORGANISM="Scrippsiella Hangoei, Strain SHTV-5" /LENGTH=69 /DNA_ID=CAMNT_0050962279 /DNA_START=179 /DNA_END=385 /DNA_ORIENTATION=-